MVWIVCFAVCMMQDRMMLGMAFLPEDRPTVKETLANMQQFRDKYLKFAGECCSAPGGLGCCSAVLMQQSYVGVVRHTISLSEVG